MAEPPFDMAKAHRWFGIELNNAAWNWLEAGNYSSPEAEQMVHAAHASCHHWSQVGTVINVLRGECLVANVHAAIGDGKGALRHARRCEQLLGEKSIACADWDIAFAYDCLARAYAAQGDAMRAMDIRAAARAIGDKIADADEKLMFDRWHAAGNWHGLKSIS
jgi:hypothetical protein